MCSAVTTLCVEPIKYVLNLTQVSCRANTDTQVELVLTTEDLLRSLHSHKRFITGRKTIKSIVNAATENGEDSICRRCNIHFLEWIYFGFKEISHQLWGGQRYDTLEIIQEILNSNLVRYIIV